MRMRLTVVSPGAVGETDVDVEATPHHTVADLLGALVTELGLTSQPGLSVAVGEQVLPDHDRLGLPPLVDGAVIRVESAVRPTAHRAGRRSVLHLAVTGGPDAGRLFPLPPGTHRVGRSPDVEVPVADDELSRVHAAVTVTDSGVRVEDLGSTNGTWVDGRRLTSGSHAIGPGQLIALGCTRMTLRTDGTRPAAIRPAGDGTVRVNRRPRLVPPPATPTITLPTPPEAPSRPRIPWVAVVAPLPVGVALAALFGPQMLLFGLMGPVMALATVSGDRFGAGRDRRERLAAYAVELASARERLAAALAAEHRERLASHPDPAEVLLTASTPGHRLWERRPEGRDVLAVRIGTGSVSARVLVRDPTAQESSSPRLHEAPVTVRLGEVGVLGLCGPRPVVLGSARVVVGQLATSHSPHDLALSAVWSDHRPDWAWLTRLPHSRRSRDDPSSARCASLHEGAAGLLRELRTVLEQREEDVRRPCAGATRPRHVVLVDGGEDARALSDLAALLDRGPAVGMHAIVLDSGPDRLPSECGAVVHVGTAGPGSLAVADGPGHQDVVCDRVGDWWAERLSRSLAPLRDATPADAGSAIPDTARLVAVAGVDPDDPAGVVDRWSRSPGEPTAVVGVTSQGPYVLDLRAHGPHALVGGTTGSGKSEFLQTLVTSLALTNRPEDISFVLVDYKGGSAFAECGQLPHSVGVMTDLDPHLTQRALRSLGAELRRRERLLHAAGAKDLDDYRRGGQDGREHLARLVLVIDEFRVLADELPEFLHGLIRIAATGRSLGVHLVLATQRPGGIVSADVKANVNLRIALRVRDRIDSDDVIESPDATGISERTPGRALARSGGSTLVTFQTARVGGHDDDRSEISVSAVGPGPSPAPTRTAPGHSEPTDLSRLVTTIRAAARVTGARTPHVPWLPPLPETFTLDDLPDLGSGPDGPPPAGAAWGLVDMPDEQRQTPLLWAPGDGHLAVVGSAGSGRTTALRTLATALARAHSPGELHVYAVDGGGSLGHLHALPHVGAVVPCDDAPRVARLVTRLAHEVTRRRALLAEGGFGSLDEWWTASAHDAPPHLVLLIDGWERVTAPTAPHDHGSLTEHLLALIRDGTAVGLRVAVTGDRSVLLGRVASYLDTTLVLRLADPADLALSGIPRDGVPEHQPPGRAVCVQDHTEVQIALLHRDATTARQNAVVGEVATARGRDVVPSDRVPFRVDPLPTRVALEDIERTRTADRTASPAAALVGTGGDDVVPVDLDLDRDGRHILVAGPARSGRTTALRTLALGFLRARLPVGIVSRTPSALTELRAHPGVRACVDGDQADALVTARREHPELVVVVDDADQLLDTPADSVLRKISALLDRDRGGLVVAATSSTLAAQFRGVAVDVARRQTGLLLSPRGVADGDLFGIRVTGTSPLLAGRGLLIRQGEAIAVQVATDAGEPPVRELTALASSVSPRGGPPRTTPGRSA